MRRIYATIAILAVLVLGACSAPENLSSGTTGAETSSANSEIATSPQSESIVSSNDSSASNESRRSDWLTGSSFESLGYKLNDLVMDSPSTVAERIGALAPIPNTEKAVSFNSETASLFNEVQFASFGNVDQLIQGELPEAVRDLKPWKLDVGGTGGTLDLYSAEELYAGADPSSADFFTYRAVKEPTCEEVATIVSEAFDYDQISIFYDSDGFDGWINYYGVARRGDCISRIEATNYGSIVDVSIYCSNVAFDQEFERVYNEGNVWGRSSSTYTDYYRE